VASSAAVATLAWRRRSVVEEFGYVVLGIDELLRNPWAFTLENEKRVSEVAKGRESMKTYTSSSLRAGARFLFWSEVGSAECPCNRKV
jgi:hypothetical protein